MEGLTDSTVSVTWCMNEGAKYFYEYSISPGSLSTWAGIGDDERSPITRPIIPIPSSDTYFELGVHCVHKVVN
jgi:hypothetical protein